MSSWPILACSSWISFSFDRSGDSLVTLNMGTPLKQDIFNFVGRYYPSLLPLYREIYMNGNPAYLRDLSKKIRTYCKENQVRAEVFF